MPNIFLIDDKHVSYWCKTDGWKYRQQYFQIASYNVSMQVASFWKWSWQHFFLYKWSIFMVPKTTSLHVLQASTLHMFGVHTKTMVSCSCICCISITCRHPANMLHINFTIVNYSSIWCAPFFWKKTYGVLLCFEHFCIRLWWFLMRNLHSVVTA